MKKPLVMLAAVLVLGCAQPQPQPQPPVTDAQSSDQQIGGQIRRALDLADPQGTGNIAIEVAAGVVTLRGAVQDIRTAWRAVAAAQSVAGVKQVNNRLLVNSP
jgi:osmotically-inducible protein OsmY